MRPRFDPGCFDAFEQMLAQADPPDLPRRAHVYRCAGDPNRRTTRLPGILMGWLQRRHLEVDVEEPVAPAIWTAKRRGRPVPPGLRILRPASTG